MEGLIAEAGVDEDEETEGAADEVEGLMADAGVDEETAGTS